MNAQQISLNLVAQLDQGNIQSQAAQMAMNMSRAMEEAFRGFGDQIAASILGSVRQALQGSIEMIGQARVPGFIPMTETERQLASSQASAPRGVYTPDGQFHPVGQPPVVPPTAPQPPAPQAPSPQGQPAAGPARGEETETVGGFLMPTRKQLSKGLQALGGGIELMGELPGLLRRSAAAGAEVDNLEARTAMRGDVEQMMAIQRLGGQDALRGRARLEEGTQIAGEIAAAVGLAMAPVSGGLSLLLGASALGIGVDAFRRTAGFNERVNQNIMGQTEAERRQNEEIYTFLQRGRETAVRGFDAARQSGAPELSGLMAGGGDANLAGNAAVQAREARDRLREQISTAQMNTPGDTMAIQSLRQRETQLTNRINELESQGAQANPFMVTSGGRNVSLRQFAAQFGIREDEFLQTMQGVGSMGGAFMGEQNRTPGANQIAELIRLQGIGLPNAAGIASQLFQSGGMTRGESIDTVRQVFEDAVSAGMDKAQVGRAMTEMAARAGQLGFGGAGVAATEMQRSMGLAQAAFSSTVEGPEMRFAQQINQQLTEAGRSKTADLGKIGGQIGVERFARRLGLKGLRREDLADLQELGTDQASIEAFARSHGASAEDIARMEQGGDLGTQLESEKQRGILESAERAFGSRRTAELFIRRQTGVNTLSGAQKLHDLLGPIREGQGGQPQIYDFNDKTGDFFKRSDAASGLQEQVGVDFDSKTGALTPRMRDIPMAEAGARQAPGAAPARALAQMDAAQISAGLNDLNQILPVLNQSLSRLVERANSVLSGNTGAAATGSEIDSLITGAVRGQNRSFMTGKAPRS
jgi:hypothetical protein